ncbi:hypothetical protein [Variovorax sp. RO1]|uniref:hypothetical protein n=1 Tax=Variovorax sp. RO1 TaxID=2066034 RepID=UPI00117C06B0|nr:hypothetical protein [Variovorax sp. RO1]
MALDPRNTFGKLSAGAAQAPRAAQLVPEDSIQSATLPALAMAKLGDTIEQSAEVIRKAGITNDRQKLEAYGAELGAREAQIRVEQQKQQQEKGEMWTPEQLQTDYNQRLDQAKAELSPKYKVDWLGDEKGAYEQKWVGAANESYMRSVVQPRIADIGRRNIEQIAQSHQTRAATLSAGGDILGALAASAAAAEAYESGPAAVLFTPDQVATRKNRIWSDGAMKTLAIQDPKRVVELTDASLALRAAADKSGDQSALIADPLRGFSTTKLLDLQNDFGQYAKRADEEKARELEKQQRVEANGYQNEVILFMTDPKTSSHQIGQRLVLERSKMKDMIANDPGNPMLDVVGRSVVQMTNELEQRQRKAQADANRVAKEGQADAGLGDFVASGARIDPTDPKSRKMGDALYDKLQTANGYNKLNPAQQQDFDQQYVGRFGYLPEKRERELKQRANSNDPAIAADAVRRLSTLTKIDSNVMEQLPKPMQTIIHNVDRHGMTPEAARKGVLDDQIRTPEEQAVIKDRIKLNTDSTSTKMAPFSAQKVLGPAFKGATLPPQVEATYQANFGNSFKTNNQDADAASKDAAAVVQRDYSVSTTDGKKVVRYKQPDKFGIAEPDLKYQQEKYLKGFQINERGLDKDGKDVVITTTLSGTENTQYTYVGQKGKHPVYRVNVLDKRTGVPKPLIDARGPVEIEFDPNDKRPPEVIVKKPGLAERTGKKGNPLARSAASFNTPSNPSTQQPQGDW